MEFSGKLREAQLFIFDWQKGKWYHYNPLLSLADCIELLSDISRNERIDDGYHGWKVHVLEYEDFILAWESGEPIDDMWFAIVDALK